MSCLPRTRRDTASRIGPACVSRLLPVSLRFRKGTRSKFARQQVSGHELRAQEEATAHDKFATNKHLSCFTVISIQMRERRMRHGFGERPTHPEQLRTILLRQFDRTNARANSVDFRASVWTFIASVFAPSPPVRRGHVSMSDWRQSASFFTAVQT